MINIIEECRDAKTIGISGHIKPDGDCIGSTLALSLYLKKVFPEKHITVYSDDVSSAFDCVEGVQTFNNSYEGPDADVFIVIDTVENRIGNADKFFKHAGKTINIDHHVSNTEGCGDVNYVVPTASSASELVYELIDKKYMDTEIAEALYLGIAHDTGIFKYSNTSPKTMRIVAELLSYDFDFPTLLDKTFYEKTYEQNLALGRILLESRRFLDGKVILGFMNIKTMTEMGITSKDFDGVINQLRITQGVECAVFMYQMNAETYKVSLRSKNIVDVSKIAVSFGGGGHVRASGFYAKDTPEKLTEKLLQMIEEELKTENE
ncbi:MAG: bifunctional oligoribonuclease/PAP phosphatase NrnA [Lachnospiraceae bacterium]|nr:bifunctional oligoribonuclease/PAP phosphatase NrnA [Lachnospiraceae bacterium]